MNSYTVFALFATQLTIELKCIFLSVLILPLVCNIQLRMINKHPICSHIKQHLSHNKNDSMGNNIFSIKLTGNQFEQKKDQELVLNTLKEKNHLKLRRNVSLLMISLVYQDPYLFTDIKKYFRIMAKLVNFQQTT